MAGKLYKVNVEVDVFVFASSPLEAAQIAKQNAGQEVAEFAKAHASEVNSVYDIAEDWFHIVPYSVNSIEKRSCAAIMKENKTEIVSQPDPEVIPISLKEEKHHEDLPVPLPQEDSELPKLRFKI